MVAAGEALLRPRVTRRLIEQFAALPGRPATRVDDGLTDREREVLLAVSQGPVQPGDRRPAAPGLRHREDARQPPADQARLPRPGAAGDVRLRVRPHRPGQQLTSASGLERDPGRCAGPSPAARLVERPDRPATPPEVPHVTTTPRGHDLPRARLLAWPSASPSRCPTPASTCCSVRSLPSRRSSSSRSPSPLAAGAAPLWGELRAQPLGQAPVAVRAGRAHAPGRQRVRRGPALDVAGPASIDLTSSGVASLVPEPGDHSGLHDRPLPGRGDRLARVTSCRGSSSSPAGVGLRSSPASSTAASTCR